MLKRTKKSLLALLMLVTLLVSSAGMAMASDMLPVDGRDPDADVSLTITHRYLPSGAVVEGATWSLYQVNVPAGETWDGTIAMAQAQGWISSTAAATGTTNSQGVVVLNPGEQGIFLAVNSAIVGYGESNLAPSFLVSLPMIVDGEWVYDVYAYPKLIDEDIFGKEIIEEYFDDGVLRIVWEFDVAIPANIGDIYCVYADLDGDCDCAANACVYIRITDILDERLVLDADSMEVRIGNTVLPATAFTVTEIADGFTVEIGAAGLALIAADAPANLYVTFTTNVIPVPCDDCDAHDPYCADCREATLGHLENLGELELGRDVFIGEPREIPSTTLFGLEVVKINLDGDELDDAVFRLYHYVDGDMVFVAEGTTGDFAEGRVRFSPLVEGTFYLVEVAAPEGYQTINEPMQVVISAANATNSVVTVSVTNIPEGGEDWRLPMTGGMGTILLTIIGAALLGGATLFFVSSKKRKKA